MEHVKVAQFFTRTDKLDRLTGNCPCGKSRTATGVTVKLCENQAVDSERFVERGCHIDGVLTGHGVNDKQDFVGLYLSFDIFQLVHKLFVNMQTAGGIQKNIVMSVILCERHGASCDLNRIDLTHFENGYTRLFTDDLKLLDRRRTVNVAGNKQGSVSLIFKHESKLCTVGGFTGALQAAHHDDGRRMVGDGESCFRSAHKGNQFFVDDFDNHLRRRQAFHNLGADGTLGNGFRKVLGDFIVDVGLQKGKSHLTHCVLNVAFGQCALTFQLFKSGFESV